MRPGIVYVTLSAWGHEGPGASARLRHGRAVRERLRLQGRTSRSPRSCRSRRRTMSRAICSRSARWSRSDAARAKAEAGSCALRSPAPAISSASTACRCCRIRSPAIRTAGGGSRRALTEHDSPIGRLTHLKPVVQMSETPAALGAAVRAAGLQPGRMAGAGLILLDRPRDTCPIR